MEHFLTMRDLQAISFLFIFTTKHSELQHFVKQCPLLQHWLYHDCILSVDTWSAIERLYSHFLKKYLFFHLCFTEEENFTSHSADLLPSEQYRMLHTLHCVLFCHPGLLKKQKENWNTCNRNKCVCRMYLTWGCDHMMSFIIHSIMWYKERVQRKGWKGGKGMRRGGWCADPFTQLWEYETKGSKSFKISFGKTSALRWDYIGTTLGPNIVPIHRRWAKLACPNVGILYWDNIVLAWMVAWVCRVYVGYLCCPDVQPTLSRYSANTVSQAKF